MIQFSSCSYSIELNPFEIEHILDFLTRLLWEESAANPASEIICFANAAMPLDWLLSNPFCTPCSRLTSSLATICDS